MEEESKFFDFDLEEDELDILMEDVNELLQDLETGILQLEEKADVEVIGVIFRSAHTLKALAGTIGHYQMAELTHAMENLFEAMRDGVIKPTAEVADDLLDALDTLKIQRDEIFTRERSGVDVDTILEQIHDLMHGEKKPVVQEKEVSGGDHPLTSEQVVQIEQYLQARRVVLEAKVFVAPNTFAPAARLSQAAMAAMDAGTVIVQDPTMDDLANIKHDNKLYLIVVADEELEDVKKILEEVVDLTIDYIRPYREEEIESRFEDDEDEEEFEDEEIDTLGQISIPDTEYFTETPVVSPSQKVVPVSGKTTPSRTKSKRRPSRDAKIAKDKTVRISVERLDNLMNLVGELVTDRNRLVQVESVLRAQYGKEGDISQLTEMTTHFGRVIDQLQEEVMRARMLPIAHLFDKVPRVVRDVARAVGKQVRMVVEGEATELDRSLIEVINDPLVHLIRNAVDHGIETPEDRIDSGKEPTGILCLSADHVEGQIQITIQDDGKGIDPNTIRNVVVKKGILTEEEANQLDDEDAIDFIFRPNLSSSDTVTEYSGRGVGLDVVRTSIEQLSGSVVVESQIGVGTIFSVTLPLTLAIVDAMLVKVRNTVYAIPLSSIIESLYLSEVTISTVRKQPTIRWRDSILPLLDLRKFFDHPRMKHGKVDIVVKPAVVTVTWGKLKVGLVVDKIIGNQGIVVKSLSPVIGEIPGLSGAAILGDGSICLILDIPGLINSALQFRKQGGFA
ncbi:MAG: hypothetical protein B6242_04620 [Anaerolineaceae bacterium 4572_78]|nr:MAG: hypothetical protein B6242_04620 [Anaerolineaceae bacterium 4572_78]